MSRLIITLLFVTSVSSFTFSDCGLRNATVHFSNITISPDPIKLASPLKVSGAIKIDKDIEMGSRSRLTVWRVVNLFWTWPIEVRVGCMSGYGSCSRDLCDRIRHSDVICSFLTKANATCDCPLKARDEPYSTINNQIEIPGSMGVSFLARVSVNDRSSSNFSTPFLNPVT